MKKAGVFIFLALAVSAVVFTNGLWLPQAARWLIVNEKLVPADVIIVPSGNEQNLRIVYAAKLYKEGYAHKVLLSGRLALEKETGINLGRIYAVSLGVAEKDIILEMDSASTFENALFSKKVIADNGFKSVILATYPIHTRRTRYIFKRVLPKQIAIYTVCDKGAFDAGRWWGNSDSARNVIYEYFAFFWYLLFRK